MCQASKITWTFELSVCECRNHVLNSDTFSLKPNILAVLWFVNVPSKTTERTFKPSVWSNSMQSFIKCTWTLAGHLSWRTYTIGCFQCQVIPTTMNTKLPWQGYHQGLVQQFHSQLCPHIVLFWDPILWLCVRLLHQQLTLYQTSTVSLQPPFQWAWWH